jgi:hypothetical protein
MPRPMSRAWCHVCDVDYFTHHAWLHRQSQTHKRKVNERFPLPPSPWAANVAQQQLITPRETLPHLGYLRPTSKRQNVK